MLLLQPREGEVHAPPGDVGHRGLTQHAPYVLAGSGLYLLGVIAVTIGFSVPRNTALAEVEPASAAAATAWTGYLAEWKAGHHVRAAAALAAAVSLTLALPGV